MSVVRWKTVYSDKYKKNGAVMHRKATRLYRKALPLSYTIASKAGGASAILATNTTSALRGEADEDAIELDEDAPEPVYGDDLDANVYLMLYDFLFVWHHLGPSIAI